VPVERLVGWGFVGPGRVRPVSGVWASVSSRPVPPLRGRAARIAFLAVFFLVLRLPGGLWARALRLFPVRFVDGVRRAAFALPDLVRFRAVLRAFFAMSEAPAGFDCVPLSDVSSIAYRDTSDSILQPAGAAIRQIVSRRIYFSMATDNRQQNIIKGGGALGTAEKSSGFSPLDDQVDPQEYARLLDLYDSSFRNIAEGEVVKGTVLKVTPSEVIVDVGYKSEGIIPVDEFVDETGQITVQPGDTVDVLLERTEDREGYVVLSREKAEKMKIWDEVEKAYAERKVVIGRVIERIKGGLAVDIGVRAFLPGSQIDVRPVRNLDALRGQELRMRVIKVNKKRGNIVLSRKVLLEEENAEKKKHTLDTLAEGKVLTGVVKNITDYGAFIDLGGIDGLLHITDMSWGRVSHPSELFKVNDEIDVIVLKYDPTTERVSLGHKQLKNDPCAIRSAREWAARW
jgi:predicted RNA-binding protein with RPS1 domain